MNIRLIISFVLIIAIIGVFISEDKLPFILAICGSWLGSYFFPTPAYKRSKSGKQSKIPLSFWQSPFPYIGFIAVTLLFWVNY